MQQNCVIVERKREFIITQGIGWLVVINYYKIELSHKK